MTTKRVVRVLLLLFLAISAGVFLARHFDVSISNPLKSRAPHAVVVYYFHGDARCPTCRTIERYTRDALVEKYAEALARNDLVFSLVNIALPENKHFVTDFGITAQSVVVADFRDGRQMRWKKLDQVWGFVSARFQFVDYIQSEVADYLGSEV